MARNEKCINLDFYTNFTLNIHESSNRIFEDVQCVLIRFSFILLV